jgi:multiple sugar transport system substrate-binding protein
LPAERRRSPGLVLLALLSATAIAAGACGQSSSSGSAGASASQSAAATTGTESEAPSGSAGEPSGSAAAPSGSAATGTADISGDLQVGARYGCEPAPCVPDPEAEGVTDEIAYTRYNVFAEQYGDVNLTFTESDFDAQQFLTSVAAGNPPDVVRIGRDLFGTYVAEGALEPLDTCINDFGIDMAQYREAAVAQVTIDGSVYGIPEFFDSRIILVNDSVVEEAGLTPEDIDTSDWDALSAANEQMLQAEGGSITRIGFDPKLPEFLPLWAKANGVDILSEDGLTSQLDDPAVAEALQYATSLITAHGDGPAFLDFRANGPGGVDFFGADNQFAADTLGAMPMEQWYLNVLAENTPEEEISFVPFKDRQGNNLSLSGGSAWAIPASADNKEAACEFMRVITLPDSWYAAAKVRADQRAADGEPFTGTFTGNIEADERIFSELVTEESAGAYYEGVQLVLEVSESSFALPPTPAAEEFTRIWQAAVNAVINEGQDASEALAQADREAQDAIDSAQ